jgi:hypothetical protein
MFERLALVFSYLKHAFWVRTHMSTERTRTF